MSQPILMVRTNPYYLQFTEKLFAESSNRPDFVLKHFEPGSFLLRQGAIATKVMVVKEGITKCYLSEVNGKDYIIEFLSTGESIGDLEAIRNTPCLCHVEALTSVQAYAIDMPYFKHLLERNLELNQLLLQVLAERVMNTSLRSSAQQLYTVEHGVKKLLELQTRQQASFSKEDMAAYLGITLRSLNRALKNLSEEA